MVRWFRIVFLFFVFTQIGSFTVRASIDLAQLRQEIVNDSYGRLPNVCLKDKKKLLRYRDYLLARMWRYIRLSKKISLIKKYQNHSSCFSRILKSKRKESDHLWDQGDAMVEKEFISLCQLPIKRSWPLIRFLYSKSLFKQLNKGQYLDVECAKEMKSTQIKINKELILTN